MFIINWCLTGLIGFIFAYILVYKYLWNIIITKSKFPLHYFAIYSILFGYFAFLFHLLIILIYYCFIKEKIN